METFDLRKSDDWKEFLGQSVPGGFDSRKHSVKIHDAISNAERNHNEAVSSKPSLFSTSVFRLAKQITARIGEFTISISYVIYIGKDVVWTHWNELSTVPR